MSKFLSGRQSNLNLGISSFTANQTVLQTIGKVGIGTTTAQQHSLFVVGSANITDQLYIGGVTVSGGSSISADIDTRNLNVSGIATIHTLNVSTNFDVYDTQAVFHNNVRIDGNLSIGGTATTIIAQDLKVLDKEITLGITTDAFGNDISNDNTANHGGIAIASTEGSPLVDLILAGYSTTPRTYKQLMWVAANSYGIGTTDAWMFNYAVGIGSTLVPNGVRFAVKEIQFTDDTIITPYLNVTKGLKVSGVSTFSGISTFTDVLVGGASTFVGVGTFQHDLYVKDTLYANALSITGGSSVSADVETRNLKVTGISTFSGISTFTDVLVGGASTFVGVGTFQSDLYVGQNLYANTLSIVGGSSVGADVETRNLKVTGISTLGISSFTDILVGGASTFVGVGTFQHDLYVKDTLYANALSITGGSAVGLDIQTRNLKVTGISTLGISSFTDVIVSGISTFVGFATFRGNVSIAGTLDVNGDINFNGNLFQDNQPFVASRWTAGEGTEIYRLSNVGIGTTNPTQDLDIAGDIRIRGGIYDSSDSSGPFNYVIASDGAGAWSWKQINQIGAGTIDGISVYDEETIVGSAGSITDIYFVGNNVSVNTPLINSGIATVKISDTPSFDSLNVSGITTLGITSITNLSVGSTTGITTSIFYGDVGIRTNNTQNHALYVNGDANITGIISATAYYGSGINLTDLIDTINISKIEGLEIKDEGSIVGSGATFVTLDFRGPGVVATGIGSTALITISGSGGGGEIFIQEEGVQVGAAVTTINIVGPRITAVNSSVGIATISVDIDYFPTGDYGDLTGTTTDAFGVPLSYAFDCLIQPPYSLTTVDLQVLT